MQHLGITILKIVKITVIWIYQYWEKSRLGWDFVIHIIMLFQTLIQISLHTVCHALIYALLRKTKTFCSSAMLLPLEIKYLGDPWLLACLIMLFRCISKFICCICIVWIERNTTHLSVYSLWGLIEYLKSYFELAIVSSSFFDLMMLWNLI